MAAIDVRILYVATDQRVPGTLGGSVHVAAVAEGLAALGHEVHALVTPGGPAEAGLYEDWPPGPAEAGRPREMGGLSEKGGVHWHACAPPGGRRQLRFLLAGRVARLARQVRPDIVMERYYNFGGEGLRAARQRQAPYVLEVNAPVIDFPGSAKRRLDRLLLVEPMRRWRERLCRAAALIVTPSAAIVPPWIPEDRVLAIEWGADTDRFIPDAQGEVPFARRPDRVVALFAGAFRSWHGAVHLVRGIRLLRARGRSPIDVVLVGDGPELPRVRQEAEGVDGITFTGAVAHDRMPACLAAADVGVAPFDVTAHAPLALGFYWSPLKVFEYMAAGRPVVAPDIDRLRTIVRHEREGLLYEAGDLEGLASALDRLTDPQLRASMGAAARQRVVERFSWAAHCRALDVALRRVTCAS